MIYRIGDVVNIKSNSGVYRYFYEAMRYFHITEKAKLITDENIVPRGMVWELEPPPMDSDRFTRHWIILNRVNDPSPFSDDVIYLVRNAQGDVMITDSSYFELVRPSSLEEARANPPIGELYKLY